MQSEGERVRLCECVCACAGVCVCVCVRLSEGELHGEILGPIQVLMLVLVCTWFCWYYLLSLSLSFTISCLCPYLCLSEGDRLSLLITLSASYPSVPPLSHNMLHKLSLKDRGRVSCLFSHVQRDIWDVVFTLLPLVQIFYFKFKMNFRDAAVALSKQVRVKTSISEHF